MNPQAEKVQQFIDSSNLLSKNETLLVALSGGADSVCLLLMLQELGYEVECVHCNFHLRDQESMRDEAFVRSLCEHRHITLHVQDFDTNTFAQEHHLSIEMAARKQRYDCFEKLLKERHLSAVCVGHHRDDNVETLLLNLVRGTGLRGLCGIQPKQGHVVRPLLCLSKTEILDYLAAMGADYVTDSTNLHTDFARNKIRLDILPRLREINPAVDENILTCIDNMNEVQRMYQYTVDEICAAALDGPSELDIATIMRAPSPISILHELLCPLGFNRSQIKDILNSIHTTGKHFTSPTHRLVVNRDQLVISDNLATFNAQLSSTISPNTPDFVFEKDGKHAYYDADKLEGKNLTVRKVKTGDRFRPFGMKGTKLVSDLLTDLKLSLFEKERQMVLCADDEIIWVIGRRASDSYKVTKETKRVECFTQLS